MLGYLKPYIPELLVREHTRYRAIYCGVCKSLETFHGQFERLGLSYDITFLVLFLLAFEEETDDSQEQSCLKHLGKKQPMLKPRALTEFAAGLSCYLALAQAEDDLRDGQALKAGITKLFFSSGAEKFKCAYPVLTQEIQAGLEEFWEYEATHFPEEAQNSLETARIVAETSAAYSGKLLASIFEEALKLLETKVFQDSRYLHLLMIFAQSLGEWVYLIDALDDKEKDEERGLFNPYFGLETEEYLPLAVDLLASRQSALDYRGALFPYYKDAGIIENILHLALPRQVAEVVRKKGNLAEQYLLKVENQYSEQMLSERDEMLGPDQEKVEPRDERN